MDRLSVLNQQLDITWRLAGESLGNLTSEEALWLPSSTSWTVREDADGRWRADWEDPEPVLPPASSIAWVQWHVIWWWSTVIDRSFGKGDLVIADVDWPGAGESMDAIDGLREDWLARLDELTDEDLSEGKLTRWPYTDGRAFISVVAWVNIELTKNIAEMAILRRATPFYGLATDD